LVQFASNAMVALKFNQLIENPRGGSCAEPGKQRFFLIRSVALPTRAKVL